MHTPVGRAIPLVVSPGIGGRCCVFVTIPGKYGYMTGKGMFVPFLMIWSVQKNPGGAMHGILKTIVPPTDIGTTASALGGATIMNASMMMVTAIPSAGILLPIPARISQV